MCELRKSASRSLTLPPNKRGVLHGETDKHLDKLNKPFTRSFWDCVFIFVSSNSYEESCRFICLGLRRRFVELVSKTNYILTLFSFFVLTCLFLFYRLAVEHKLLQGSRSPHPHRHPGNIQPISQIVIVRNERTPVCTFFLTPLQWKTKGHAP